MAEKPPTTFYRRLAAVLYSIAEFTYRLFIKPSVRWSSPAMLGAWSQVNSEKAMFFLDHERYWWNSSGFALAILLKEAGYSYEAQYQALKFFVETIASSLGVPHNLGLPIWKSFMTDDNNPIEMSWDWNTGDKPLKIRFSIEPVGINAGTCNDPDNQNAASDFQKTLLQRLPKINVDWLNHLELHLNTDTPNAASVEGHSSKIFYAFDLGDKDIMAKAYFFPGYKARATRRSNLEVILETIDTAPHLGNEIHRALKIFQDYANDTTTPKLEIDMLAIDLVNPEESRFKIYFRIRETTALSIKEAMTLGDRLVSPDLDHGLQDLLQFYKALLDDTHPPNANHRTAGLLYNVEFQSRMKTPKVKIYIPVRHYGGSEMEIMETLSRALGQTNAGRAASVESYIRAMRQTL